LEDSFIVTPSLVFIIIEKKFFSKSKTEKDSDYDDNNMGFLRNDSRIFFVLSLVK